MAEQGQRCLRTIDVLILFPSLFVGYVPVVNRGQRDIEGKKSIRSALDAEKEFFENHTSYRSKAQYCGTAYLARRLNMVCLNVLVHNLYLLR